MKTTHGKQITEPSQLEKYVVKKEVSSQEALGNISS
jgi:hypothetical protein